MSRDDKKKRNRQSAFTNPVLVGAMTLLVAMVAVSALPGSVSDGV